MLLVALTCFSANKNNNYFFKRKKKREKKEEKKDMRFNSHVAASVKVFGKKILPEAQRRRGYFFSKPAGLDLY